jgi:hypothetical protein
LPRSISRATPSSSAPRERWRTGPHRPSGNGVGAGVAERLTVGVNPDSPCGGGRRTLTKAHRDFDLRRLRRAWASTGLPATVTPAGLLQSDASGPPFRAWSPGLSRELVNATHCTIGIGKLTGREPAALGLSLFLAHGFRKGSTRILEKSGHPNWKRRGARILVGARRRSALVSVGRSASSASRDTE